MACQTGIRANDDLRNAFNQGKQARLRLIKVVVKNEELSSNYELAGSSNWREDWRLALPDCVDSFEPCFLLFRLNTITEWILITFAEDKAPVKEKMLLAATCSTFKSEFGPSYIEHERHVTDRKELTLEAFEQWLKAKTDIGPMSEVEKELHQAAQERSAVNHAGPQHMKGVAFPLDRNAEDAVKQLAKGDLNFVQLSVDTLNEAIKLECTEASLAADALARRIPRDKPRYTFYRFDHEHEGRPLRSTFFIYSLPSSGSSIKERMLYSSCKGPFLETSTKYLGVEISKKMEVDARDDLSEKALIETLHPAPQESPKHFARPTPPKNAGPRRITKKNPEPRAVSEFLEEKEGINADFLVSSRKRRNFNALTFVTQVFFLQFVAKSNFSDMLFITFGANLFCCLYCFIYDTETELKLIRVHICSFILTR